MKAVEVKVVCDQCVKAVDSNPRPADYTVIYRLGDSDDEHEYRVDLCADHAKRLLLADVIALGYHGGPVTRRRARVRCPICGQDVGEGAGLAAHTRLTHPRPKEAT
jgi:endogenous inhibitor of DNA gyrase (YacG/DUF329 family)